MWSVKPGCVFARSPFRELAGRHAACVLDSPPGMGGPMAHRVSVATLKRILARQEPRRFLRDYQPSIRATRDEAPSKSSVFQIVSPRLGREIHLLSTGERALALLALYHPKLADLHEQWMLPRWPAAHPLEGFPGCSQDRLPTFRGSTEVADRLGYLDVIPVLRSGGEPIVFPFIGDLLLYLRDESGYYCVNWNIKEREGDHALPGPECRPPYSAEALRKSRARFEIEVHTVLDAGIRTAALAHESINATVADNLSDLHSAQDFGAGLSASATAYAEQCFQRAIDVGDTPAEVVAYLVHRGLCSREEAIRAFKTAVFQRRIRVDLFRRILMDYPARPEQVDVLDHYARWFAR